MFSRMAIIELNLPAASSVAVDDALVVAAQHVDVRRHVDQMTRVGHQVAQFVAGAQRALANASISPARSSLSLSS